MRIFIASDHAGYELKEAARDRLRQAGHEVTDCGPTSYDPLDDYPSFCLSCGKAVVAHPGSLGIVIGGSGNGEQMAANLVDGVRCALVWNEDTATLARQHNDANVVSVGARMHEREEALALIDAFIATPFSGDGRHARRIAQMAAYERGRCGSV